MKCVNFKPYESGTLQGFAELEIEKWGVRIPGFELHQKGDKSWVNLPKKEYTNRDGEKAYTSFFFFIDREHFRPFCIQAKEAVKSYLAKGESAEKDVKEEDFQELFF